MARPRSPPGQMQGLFPRVSRLPPARLIENPTRRDLLARLCAEPGLYVAAIHQRTGIPETVVLYHLRVLASAGLVTPLRVGKRVHWFPAGSRPEGEMRRLAVARGEAAERILHLVERAPGATTGEIARRCGLSPSRVSRTVARLEEHGYLTRTREGATTRTFPRRRTIQL